MATIRKAPSYDGSYTYEQTRLIELRPFLLVEGDEHPLYPDDLVTADMVGPALEVWAQLKTPQRGDTWGSRDQTYTDWKIGLVYGDHLDSLLNGLKVLETS